MLEYADKQTQEKLIEAVNLLAEHAKRLPHGYVIVLEFTNDECCQTLEDPFGDEIEFYVDGASSFDEACVSANEHAR